MGILIWAHENNIAGYENGGRKYFYDRNYMNKYAVQNVIRDITRSRENEQYQNQLISYGAFGCDFYAPADVLIQEYLGIQKVHDIDRRKGRRMYHEIFSLLDEEIAGLYYNMNLLYYVAAECARWYFNQGYQVVFAIHHQGRFHIHFAVNTIHCITGKKFHTTKPEKEAREMLFNQILHKYQEIAKIPIVPIEFYSTHI